MDESFPFLGFQTGFSWLTGYFVYPLFIYFVLTPRYWFLILFSLSVVLKYKLRVPVYCYWKKFGKITNVGWRPSYSTKSYWWATLMTQPISNLFMHEIKSESLCLWTMFKFTLCGKHWSNHGSLKQCFPVSPTSSLGTGRNW